MRDVDGRAHTSSRRPCTQQNSQTQPVPIRVKAALSNLRQTLQRSTTHTASVVIQPPSLCMCTHGKLFRVETPQRCLFTKAWRGTDAARTSAGTWRGDTFGQEPTFTTSQKRDLHREFVRGGSSWTFLPKVDCGVAPYEGAANNPKGSVGLVRTVKHTSPPNHQTTRVPTKKNRSKNSWVPNVDLHH